MFFKMFSREKLKLFKGYLINENYFKDLLRNRNYFIASLKGGNYFKGFLRRNIVSMVCSRKKKVENCFKLTKTIYNKQKNKLLQNMWKILNKTKQ